MSGRMRVSGLCESFELAEGDPERGPVVRREFYVVGFAYRDCELRFGRMHGLEWQVSAVFRDCQPLHWTVCVAKRNLHPLIVG